MIAAWLAPALAAALIGPGSSEPPVAAPAPARSAAPIAQRGVELSATIPSLFIENEPFVVSLEVTATGESTVDLPAWMLTPAAWSASRKALQRRPKKASVPLQPGQVLTVTPRPGAPDPGALLQADRLLPRRRGREGHEAGRDLARRARG